MIPKKKEQLEEGKESDKIETVHISKHKCKGLSAGIPVRSLRLFENYPAALDSVEIQKILCHNHGFIEICFNDYHYGFYLLLGSYLLLVLSSPRTNYKILDSLLKDLKTSMYKKCSPGAYMLPLRGKNEDLDNLDKLLSKCKEVRDIGKSFKKVWTLFNSTPSTLIIWVKSILVNYCEDQIRNSKEEYKKVKENIQKKENDAYYANDIQLFSDALQCSIICLEFSKESGISKTCYYPENGEIFMEPLVYYTDHKSFLGLLLDKTSCKDRFLSKIYKEECNLVDISLLPLFSKDATKKSDLVEQLLKVGQEESEKNKELLSKSNIGILKIVRPIASVIKKNLNCEIKCDEEVNDPIEILKETCEVVSKIVIPNPEDN